MFDLETMSPVPVEESIFIMIVDIATCLSECLPCQCYRNIDLVAMKNQESHRYGQ